MAHYTQRYRLKIIRARYEGARIVEEKIIYARSWMEVLDRAQDYCSPYSKLLGVSIFIQDSEGES